MNRFACASMLAMTGLAAACSPLNLLNFTVPKDSYELSSGLSYGSASRHKLDIYRVKNGTSDAGVIIFFYGGSWRRGSRANYQFVGEAFARRGFTTIIPDYRTFPAVKFPAFVEDAALVVRWVTDNIAQYSGTADKIYLMGHSAGAHIAALLALDSRYLRRVGLDGAILKGVIGLAGPYAFDPTRFRSTRPIFAGAFKDVARPVSFTHKDAPPFLLLHGTDDNTVFPLNSEQLATQLTDVGARVIYRSYPGVGHVELLLGLSKTLEGRFPMHEHIANFLAGG